MHRVLVSDLVTLLRRDAGEVLLAARLSGRSGAPPAAALIELGRRARRQGATDEELALAVGVLLALSAETGERDVARDGDPPQSRP